MEHTLCEFFIHLQICKENPTLLIYRVIYVALYMASSNSVYIKSFRADYSGQGQTCFLSSQLSRDEKGFGSVYFSDYGFPFNMQINQPRGAATFSSSYYSALKLEVIGQEMQKINSLYQNVSQIGGFFPKIALFWIFENCVLLVDGLAAQQHEC